MLRTLTGIFITLLVLALLLISVGYWLFNYMTLEKLGYSDVEIGRTQMPSGEEIAITPKSLGIDGMTVKEIFEWFKSKLDS
ncbi:MAG: hypothetical protein K2O95_07855 [Clostridia bacterium]|nr:hypothetical protein [Clostridia bacterium]MDE7080011.1 hypothetical protein [Clostridia bacterium]